jgi:phage shock protein B
MAEVASISIGAVLIVFIVFVSLLIALTIVSWTVVRLVSGGARRRAGGAADDAQLIQEIYQGLTKMEQRIESLETLLLERDGKGAR